MRRQGSCARADPVSARATLVGIVCSSFDREHGVADQAALVVTSDEVARAAVEETSVPVQPLLPGRCQVLHQSAVLGHFAMVAMQLHPKRRQLLEAVSIRCRPADVVGHRPSMDASA